jgi:AAA+ superfamily predicted ATPase
MELKLLKAEGISIAPEKVRFQEEDDVLFYTLIFPGLPEGVAEIDIIEKENDNDFFNFYNIPLIKPKRQMSTKKLTILKKIESVALELKGDHRKSEKNYSDEIKALEPHLKDIAEFLKLSKGESAIFSLGLYLGATSDRFSLANLKSFTNFSPFDFFEIKNIIKGLMKKGWFVKGGTRGFYRGGPRGEEMTFTVAQEVQDALSENRVPEIKKKEMDVYIASKALFSYFHEHFEENMETEELHAAVSELEEEYPAIEPFQMAAGLKLVEYEKQFFYFIVAKTSNGEEVVDVDRMLSHLFKRNAEKIAMKKLLASRMSILFGDKIIEFINEEFRTDKLLKMTPDGIKKVFGEDACFLSQEKDFSSGICKLIKHDAIVEKELYYNESEQESIGTLAEFLKTEKYDGIVKRLEENKMRPGLTILLHGYPGTGKTETIYQLARQTQRNVLMVNISEIRDKWVGESEKRLKAVFETYKNSFKHFEQAPILLFNESDALIGKRIAVNTSVDQMNNAMQNILLQELEDFKGILLATTNLTNNLDEAFERRFLFKIKFDRPSVEAKKFIWKNKLDFLSDEDAQRLASEFEFSGGQIENISRKLFLDSVLLGKTNSIENIIQYCTEEILLKDNNKRKLGFGINR